MTTIYDYSYGDEDVPSIRLQIHHDYRTEIYELILTQETFEAKACYSLTTSYPILSCEKTICEGSPPTYTTVMRIRAILNPPPEELFSIAR